MTEKITRELLLQAAARGWCSPANQNKEMDADLASAIVDEIQAAIRATEQPARPSEESVRLADGLLKVPSDKNLFARSELVQILAREILRLDALAKGE